MSEKVPESGLDYCDRKGSRFHIAGRAKDWETQEEMILLRVSDKEELYCISRSEFIKEFRPDDTHGRGSLLLSFLDAQSDEEKLTIIQKRRSEITDEFLEAAAQSMDFVLREEDMESNLRELENYLRTKVRYERIRI